MNTEVAQENLQLLKFDLARPLLVMKAPNGILGCGYISVDTCNKTLEACAIVTGVSSFDDMRKARVVAVSHKAAELGVQVGEFGQDALDKMR